MDAAQAIPRTWEALQDVLQRAGHCRGGLEKIRVAREMGVRLNPARSNSSSFQVFCSLFPPSYNI